MADDKHSGGKPLDPQGEGKPAFDPFKAEDPVIPGVPKKGAAPVAPPIINLKDPKVLAAGGIGLAVVVLLAWIVFGPSDSSAPPAASQPAAAASTAPANSPAPAGGAAETPAAPAAAPMAPQVVSVPGPVGTVEDFPQQWSVKRVLIQRPTGRVPALIIRLPGGSPRRAESYWGLLLMSPYGRCELEYLTDLKKIADDYGYRARHPMVVDPCNLTVFDPTRLGDIGGIVARGAVVQGTTLRPPLAIDLRIEGNRIMAMQTE